MKGDTMSETSDDYVPEANEMILAYDEGYEGVDVTEERIIALLDNADFLYFVWVLQDELWHIRNEEARLVERAEAKRIAIELIRGTQ
jgi:hypothetical protein